jgi:hypothetical protein
MNIDLNLDRDAKGSETFPARKRERRSRDCRHCGGALREGFLIEHQGGFEPAAPTLWQSGQIGEAYWTGVDAKPAQQRRVTAHRCERCGALELFAL